MENVLLVLHIILAVALVLVILIQRSEGGGLGVGGGTMGGLMTAKGSANLLTRTTAILATGFICTSLALSIIASGATKGPSKFEADQQPAKTEQSKTPLAKTPPAEPTPPQQ